MDKNKLYKSVLLVVLFLIVLFFLRYLPEISIGKYQMKKVDIISDILYKTDTLSSEPLDSIPLYLSDTAKLRKHKLAFKDSCKEGVTCIEDYSDSTNRGMQYFYKALSDLGKTRDYVRIAYFGDSFIEADILTSDLRHNLQNKYGGKGVGLVPMSSNISGFRKSVREYSRGWSSHTIMDTTGRFQKQLSGLGNSYYIPHPGSMTELKGTNNFENFTDHFEVINLYFKNKGDLRYTIQFNGNQIDTVFSSKKNTLQENSFRGYFNSLKVRVKEADSTVFYGVAMDGLEGIILDNYSLRGSSGLNIRSVSDEMMQEFNTVRPYDLIILHYGLNVAYKGRKNYRSYYEGMQGVIDKLKKNFPKASILIVSVSDRDQKNEDGEIVTMPGIKNLVTYQKNLAAEERVAFWNLFEAMGGDNSMKAFVEHNPSWASKDYTHLNFIGGKHIAGMLYEALTWGHSEYERRKAYENE